MTQPLPRPPGRAAALTYRDDLAHVRAFAAAQARRAGLPAGRARDLVIAVSELAANTWRHTDAPRHPAHLGRRRRAARPDP